MNWQEAEVQSLGDGGYAFAVAEDGTARFLPLSEISAWVEKANGAVQPEHLGTMAYALTGSLVGASEAATDFADIDARLAALEATYGGA